MIIRNRLMTEIPLLRGLVVGFALVVLLLGAASVVAVRGTRAIEDDTARVVREQLVIARLLNEVQAGQNTLAAVLHQLSRTPGAPNQPRLLRDLEAADSALERVADSASSTPESSRWRDLHAAVQSFSQGVHGAINRRTGPVPADVVSQLFNQHDAVVKLEQELLEASEDRVSATERQIEDESRQLGSRSVILLGASLALATICAILTIIFARNSVRSMEWHANELNRVSWHMLQTQEETARRFSHELHDELGQSLAAVRANLTSTGAANWDTRRADCVNLVDSAIANVRELSQLLRPVILDDFGLDAGLRWLGESFAQRTGIRVNYQSSFSGRLPDETETHLFRIAQEAFTNVARHSGASAVEVELRSDGDSVILSVEDNGRGIRALDDRYTPSLGLTGMRARARHSGGELRISKPLGGGLKIEIHVPRHRPQEVHAV
jgi:signal transduction histidine kinase